MCGRYYIETESDLIEIRKIFAELSDRYFEQPVLKQLKGGEIFPTQVAPVIRPMATEDGIKLLPDLMQWGLPGQSLLINARSETAAVKPAFREAILHRRILVPATAFFEWQKQPSVSALQKSVKTKFQLSRQAEPVFYMAGIYLPIPPDQNPYQLPGQFVILTSPANKSLTAIHDRMPLVLPRNLLRPWLQQDALAESILQQPVEALFSAFPVK